MSDPNQKAYPRDWVAIQRYPDGDDEIVALVQDWNLACTIRNHVDPSRVRSQIRTCKLSIRELTEPPPSPSVHDEVRILRQAVESLESKLQAERDRADRLQRECDREQRERRDLLERVRAVQIVTRSAWLQLKADMEEDGG